MAMDLRFSLPALGITALATAIVVVRAASAPAPKSGRDATSAERYEIVNRISLQERDWLRQVGENFPQDNWSQRDDFHGREYKETTKISTEKGIRVEEILRVTDDDIHRASAAGPKAPDSRAAHAVPCKPRPFYD